MKRLIAILAVSAFCGSAVAANPPMLSRFTTLDETRCAELSAGEGGDQLLRRCLGYGNSAVWMLYQDSVRLRLGFGPKGSVAGMFNAERDGAWPIEWRGQILQRVFKAQAVIIRVRPPGETASHLAVFKLRADGTSCIIGDAPPGPDQNTVARRIADNARDTECEAEPDVF